MNSAFQTGPGFYAAMSQQGDQTIPPGVMRVYCARMEAYDLDSDEKIDLDTEFTILFSFAEGKPDIAKAILLLGKTIEGNRKELERMARG